MEKSNDKSGNLPYLRIKSIHFENFRAFKDCKFTFGDKRFICFVGPNGTGKSTSLEIIQMMFAKYDGYDAIRLRNYLGKGVRSEQIDEQYNGIYSDKDFLITAEIESEYGNYDVVLNKNGFVKDHPPEIKSVAYRICHTTGLDKDLRKFYLAREQWGKFKSAFEKITGYQVEEYRSPVEIVSDPVQQEITKNFVLSFLVKKPNETILHKNCSDGERKLIRALAVLLSIELTPRIILIDNIEMHIEMRRHGPLIETLQEYFPETQIFSTTHSYQIARDIKNIEKIYDLRLINAPQVLQQERWRLYMLDEIEDYIYKASLISCNKKSISMVEKGLAIKEKIMQGVDAQSVADDSKNFTKEVSENFINDVVAIKNNDNLIY